MSPVARAATVARPARARRPATLRLTVLPGPVAAHLGLPSLRGPPPLPGQVIDTATQAVAGTQDRLLAPLVGARAAAARALIRQHRALIEADPDGAPIVRAELLAFGPEAAALGAATAAGFEIVRRQALAGLEGELPTLPGPAGLSTARSLARLRHIDPAGDYDYNHIYLPSAASEEAAPLAPGAAPPDATPPGAPSAGAGIGMIDSGVDPTHPALALSHVEQSGCDGHAVPAAHGTAVASLIAGSAARFRGALPRARLIAFHVYGGEVTGGSPGGVAPAFATLTGGGGAVINVSRGGPRNPAGGGGAAGVRARGVRGVAPVGNDGPAAPPLYPAALPGVIAVTAVDTRAHVLPEAGRGPHVVFAAPGAGLRAADLQHGYTTVRGTSS